MPLTVENSPSDLTHCVRSDKYEPSKAVAPSEYL
jgi:hypothetical protein